MVAAILLALVASAGPLRIDLRGEHADRVATLLGSEIDFVRTSTAADLRLELSEQSGRILLVLEGRHTSGVRRPVSAGRGLEPALRVVALIAARTARLERTLAAEVTPPPTPPFVTVRAEVGFGATAWQAPFGPQLGPTLAVQARFSGFELGLWSGLFGAVCCEKRRAGVISADATEIPLVLEGQVELLRPAARLRLLLGVGGGLNILLLAVRPEGFQGPGLEQSSTRLEGILRADGGLELRLLPALSVSLRVGALLRVNPVEARLPSENLYGSETLRTGPIGPWAELQLTFDAR